ncbi:hypothetical protein SPHINGO391_450076 [Sphingomonas aurantiaca]|uniref:Uncharacterized protein n=1 Tax=Sphingomonas aurantiaca TaxID=185949 RepID=A0A5E7ZKW6_9SPHN|nr:hypothetical protein SPHINGO391_450076 [Sphingomonas aurantiaca]
MIGRAGKLGLSRPFRFGALAGFVRAFPTPARHPRAGGDPDPRTFVRNREVCHYGFPPPRE